MQPFNLPEGLHEITYVILILVWVSPTVIGSLITRRSMKKFQINDIKDLSKAMNDTESMKEINRKFDHDLKEIEHSKKCDADIKRDLEQAKNEHGEIQGDQQTIKQILAEVQASQKRQEESQERTELRQEIFAPTTSREMHEHQLELRDRYVSIHGNGAGRIRLQLLEEEYRRRLSNPDQSSAWNYPD
jgi:hypothetical protein